MIKLFTASLLLLCLNQSLQAQSKTPLAIFSFVASQPENKSRAAQIQQLVVELLNRKSDVELLDRTNDNLIIKELDMQIREQSMASSGLVQQGKLLGAKQMLVGTVTNVKVEHKQVTSYDLLTQKSRIVTRYNASIAFALQLSDVESGKVISQRIFDSRKVINKAFDILNVGLGNSPEEAIASAIKGTKKQIKEWLNDLFQPDIKILKVEETDKSGYPELILLAGLDGSLQKGAHITINAVEMIDTGDGKSLKRVKKMAELKVKEVQGEILVCKVTEGEKELHNKMTAGDKMEFVIK